MCCHASTLPYEDIPLSVPKATPGLHIWQLKKKAQRKPCAETFYKSLHKLHLISSPCLFLLFCLSLSPYLLSVSIFMCVFFFSHPHLLLTLPLFHSPAYLSPSSIFLLILLLLIQYVTPSSPSAYTHPSLPVAHRRVKCTGFCLKTCGGN